MSGRLANKVAVITGAASGMGKASTLRFLAEGAKVVAADLNEGNGKALVDEVDDDTRLRFLRVDVADEDDVEAMVAAAIDGFGRLDIVFNNAGLGGAFGPLTEIRREDWDYTLGVLLTGVFLGIKHGARAMRAQGEGGAIVNTASVAGLSGGAGPQAYSAAKAGVVNLTQSAAVELAPDRIRVNVICPGAVNTPLVHRGREFESAEQLDRMQPWPEHGEPDDIANAALFLASDEARFVTGETLIVDGGLTAAGPRLASGIDVGRGRVGVNRGSTGQPPTVHP